MQTGLEVISKKSFVPISALGAHFQSSKYQLYSSGLNFAVALIWNQNPNFEMTSNVSLRHKIQKA